jgi:hypothetical protein
MNEFNSLIEEFAKKDRESIEVFALMTHERIIVLDNIIANCGYGELANQTQNYRKARNDYYVAMRFLEARELYELLPPHLR